MYAKSYYEFPYRHAPVLRVTEMNFQKQIQQQTLQFLPTPCFFPSKFSLCTEISSEIPSATLLIQNMKASTAELDALILEA